MSFLKINEICSFRTASQYFYQFKTLHTQEHCDIVSRNLDTIYLEGGLHRVRQLLSDDSRVDPAANNNRLIIWASARGHLDFVSLLLKDLRVDPSSQSNEAICWACRNGHLDVVQLLLKDSRVDPSDNDNYAIRWSSSKGHLGIIKELLKDYRVDPSNADKFHTIKAKRELNNLDLSLMKT
eukprot:CAMPEP_0172491782 /NCGR_PEP_ID=MMETSP1066-20121228/22646_1 /TAXON_ID=671091 /ORGANISM="Coscinodiscus wailesii, Strain CCMP2513" /LENGTH=180 /DNA_ID=CAMNT_0013260991 /DNA_START=238 /DNA_END=780 /DNA_ORIENTATION=+